jgi:hypothetical protein
LQNTGSGTTTTLAVNTTFGIMNTQPRGPDNLGNFKVGLMAVNGTAFNLGAQSVAACIPVVQSGTAPITVGTINSGTVNTKSILTPSNVAQGTISTSSTVIVASNASRKGLTLVNTSNNAVSLAFGTTAVLNSGVVLNTYGAFYMDEYSFSTASVAGISSGTGAILGVQEYT